MTQADTIAPSAPLRLDMRAAAPPVAPLTMPKQVLVRTRRPIWRWKALGPILSLLRRDMGRAG